MADENLYADEVPVRITHACAGCEQHIDGDEVLRRTKDGWKPFHPICAPDSGAVADEFPFTVWGGLRHHDGWPKFNPIKRISKLKF